MGRSEYTERPIFLYEYLKIKRLLYYYQRLGHHTRFSS